MKYLMLLMFSLIGCNDKQPRPAYKHAIGDKVSINLPLYKNCKNGIIVSASQHRTMDGDWYAWYNIDLRVKENNTACPSLERFDQKDFHKKSVAVKPKPVLDVLPDIQVEPPTNKPITLICETCAIAIIRCHSEIIANSMHDIRTFGNEERCKLAYKQCNKRFKCKESE